MKETIQQRIRRHKAANEFSLTYYQFHEAARNLLSKCEHLIRKTVPEADLWARPPDVNLVQELVNLHMQLYYLSDLAGVDLDTATAQNLRIIER